jgi:hypothetical protein
LGEGAQILKGGQKPPVRKRERERGGKTPGPLVHSPLSQRQLEIFLQILKWHCSTVRMVRVVRVGRRVGV